MDNYQPDPQPEPEKDLVKEVESIGSKFMMVGKGRVRWVYAYLILAIVLGVGIGVGYVINGTGNFSSGSADEGSGIIPGLQDPLVDPGLDIAGEREEEEEEPINLAPDSGGASVPPTFDASKGKNCVYDKIIPKKKSGVEFTPTAVDTVKAVDQAHDECKRVVADLLSDADCAQMCEKANAYPGTCEAEVKNGVKCSAWCSPPDQNNPKIHCEYSYKGALRCSCPPD